MLGVAEGLVEGTLMCGQVFGDCETSNEEGWEGVELRRRSECHLPRVNKLRKENRNQQPEETGTAFMFGGNNQHCGE